METYMKTNFLKAAFAGVILSISSFANAGLIESDIYNDGSNKGFTIDGSALEWMDFGINNTYTYNEVANSLGLSQEYSGWRIATKSEATTLYNALFSGPEWIPAFQGDIWGNGGTRHRDDGALGLNSSMDSIFNVIGFNYDWNHGSFTDRHAYGLFSDSNGASGMQLVRRNNGTYTAADLNMFNVTGENTNPHPYVSTLLVRSAAPASSVPEPSTLAIFGLGLLGLVARRNKKQA